MLKGQTTSNVRKTVAEAKKKPQEHFSDAKTDPKRLARRQKQSEQASRAVAEYLTKQQQETVMRKKERDRA